MRTVFANSPTEPVNTTVRFPHDIRPRLASGARTEYSDRERFRSRIRQAWSDGLYSSIRAGRFWWGFALSIQERVHLYYVGPLLRDDREFHVLSPLEIGCQTLPEERTRLLSLHVKTVGLEMRIQARDMLIIPELDGLAFIPYVGVLTSSQLFEVSSE